MNTHTIEKHHKPHTTIETPVNCIRNNIISDFYTQTQVHNPYHITIFIAFSLSHICSLASHSYIQTHMVYKTVYTLHTNT